MNVNPIKSHSRNNRTCKKREQIRLEVIQGTTARSTAEDNGNQNAGHTQTYPRTSLGKGNYENYTHMQNFIRRYLNHRNRDGDGATPWKTISLPINDVFMLTFASLFPSPIGEMQIVVDEGITEEAVL